MPPAHPLSTPTEHSDFDLLIIRRGISSAKESNLEIRHALWAVDAAPASFTLLSSTPEEVDQKLRRGSPIFQDIFRHGLVLYAAQEDL